MSTSDVAKSYFAALAEHDLDRATQYWAPGGQGRLVGQLDLIAPDGISGYFGSVFRAFPDFKLEVIDMTTYRNRTAVRWRARGTFAGPAEFQGFAPTGARVELEGCDVLTIEDDRIQSNDAYFDSGSLARQLGLMPAAGSKAEARLTRATNARTRMRTRMHGAEPERVADGVWILRGGFPAKEMNVYLLEDDGGVTMFDAGISQMTAAVAAAGARMGGIRRVVLGHADADHRGTAPGLGAPVYCHEAEREAAESSDSLRPYHDLQKLNPVGRFLLGRLLPIWDGGAVEIAGTVAEGDEIAGFKVVDLPGHAPGLVGLWRESDRLALVSDCFYTLDPQTGRRGAARVPHPAFDIDVEQARASIRKLAAMEPSAAWAGHADPVKGDVRSELERAAAAPVPNA
jgi:glyoxylase-like metal-dependent hydrolase (beta-lactamase superfamily II)/predicted ester cyclase